MTASLAWAGGVVEVYSRRQGTLGGHRRKQNIISSVLEMLSLN